MATIKKRGGSYLFRCYDGYTTSGRQIERSMTWTPPEGMSEKRADKEAAHQAALFEEKVRNGQIAASSRVKFQDFAERWFSDYGETQLRPRTLARYRTLTARIYPALGHLYIDKIRPAHLMAFYKELSATVTETFYRSKLDLKAELKARKTNKKRLSEQHDISLSVMQRAVESRNIEKKSAEKIAAALELPVDAVFEKIGEEKKLSGKTVLHYHRFLSSVFQTAVQWQVITENPCSRVAPPKVQHKEIEFLDAEQSIRLLELIETEPVPYKVAVTVLLFTGMRRSELLGLKWSDMDFSNQTISISRSLHYLPGKGLFEDETKNSSSKRVIKIPTAAADALRSLKAWQAQQRLMLGELWKPTEYIFTNDTGDVLHPDSLTNWFRRFVLQTDLPPIHLHSLRHTNATLYIANGVAVTTVAGQLGHSTASTTANIYAHSIKSAQAAAAEMMDDLLAAPQKRANA